MSPRSVSRPLSRALIALAVVGGVVAGTGLVAATSLVIGPNGTYWSTQVTVPRSASATSPDVVPFHGATFTLWWPYVPPGPSTGVVGVSVTITEPSGAVVQTGTGCGACTYTQHTWYSEDGQVGIAWYDRSMGDVTLLVRV